MGDKNTSYSLPPEIVGDGHTLKLMYVWLEPQGVVNWSSQEIADKLGITKKTVVQNLQTLREKGLLKDVSEQEERRRNEYYVKRLPIHREVHGKPDTTTSQPRKNQLEDEFPPADEISF
jgi:biotin operon repressor